MDGTDSLEAPVWAKYEAEVLYCGLGLGFLPLSVFGSVPLGADYARSDPTMLSVRGLKTIRI